MTSIETASGLLFDLADPDPSLIRLDDIAHALAHMCRFTGHTDRFYSVAEHSILVMRLAGSMTDDPRLCDIAMRHGLMHDAHEAYYGDDSSPKKRLIADLCDHDVLGELHRRFDVQLFKRFRINTEAEELVKEADKLALAIEAEELMVSGPESEVWGLPMPSGPDRAMFREYANPRTTFLHYCNLLRIMER